MIHHYHLSVKAEIIDWCKRRTNADPIGCFLEPVACTKRYRDVSELERVQRLISPNAQIFKSTIRVFSELNKGIGRLTKPLEAEARFARTFCTDHALQAFRKAIVYFPTSDYARSAKWQTEAYKCGRSLQVGSYEASSIPILNSSTWCNSKVYSSHWLFGRFSKLEKYW